MEKGNSKDLQTGDFMDMTNEHADDVKAYTKYLQNDKLPKINNSQSDIDRKYLDSQAQPLATTKTNFYITGMSSFQGKSTKVLPDTAGSIQKYDDEQTYARQRKLLELITQQKSSKFSLKEEKSRVFKKKLTNQFNNTQSEINLNTLKLDRGDDQASAINYVNSLNPRSSRYELTFNSDKDRQLNVNYYMPKTTQITPIPNFNRQMKSNSNQNLLVQENENVPMQNQIEEAYASFHLEGDHATEKMNLNFDNVSNNLNPELVKRVEMRKKKMMMSTAEKFFSEKKNSKFDISHKVSNNSLNQNISSLRLHSQPNEKDRDQDRYHHENMNLEIKIENEKNIKIKNELDPTTNRLQPVNPFSLERNSEQVIPVLFKEKSASMGGIFDLAKEPEIQYNNGQQTMTLDFKNPTNIITTNISTSGADIKFNQFENEKSLLEQTKSKIIHKLMERNTDASKEYALFVSKILDFQEQSDLVKSVLQEQKSESDIRSNMFSLDNYASKIQITGSNDEIVRIKSEKEQVSDNLISGDLYQKGYYQQNIKRIFPSLSANETKMESLIPKQKILTGLNNSIEKSPEKYYKNSEPPTSPKRPQQSMVDNPDIFNSNHTSVHYQNTNNTTTNNNYNYNQTSFANSTNGASQNFQAEHRGTQIINTAIKMDSGIGAFVDEIKDSQKLFQMIDDFEKIPVHTSQNKNLMHFSQRKDVVELGDWLEQMLVDIHQNIIDDEFSSLFEDIQVVLSAAMSELIRQVGMHCYQRGALIRRIWESMLSTTQFAFVKSIKARENTEKKVKKEISDIHRHYIEMIEKTIPEIAQLQKTLERKDVIMKKVMIEYRYMRKKDAKLEKYLKVAQKELTDQQQEFDQLKEIFNSFKMFCDDPVALKTYENQFNQGLSNLKMESKQREHVYQQFDEEVRNIDRQTRLELKDFHGHNQNIEYFIEEESEVNKVVDNKNIIIREEEVVTERELIEIEGADGIKMVLASIGMQVGSDLNPKIDQILDTDELNQKGNANIQTDFLDVLNEETQTDHVNFLADNGSYQYNNGNMISEGDEQDNVSNENGENDRSINDSNSDSSGGTSERLRKEEEEEKEQNESRIRINNMNNENQAQDIINLQEHVSPLMTLLKQSSVNKYLQAELEQSENGSINTLRMGWIDQDNFDGIAGTEQVEQKKKLPHLTAHNSNVSIRTEEDEFAKPKLFYQRDTVEASLKNQIEVDLQELYIIQRCKSNYVERVLAQIIEKELLKDNDIIQPEMISEFLVDCNQFNQEEEDRFQRILHKSQFHLKDFVKLHIALADKNFELQQALETANQNKEKLFQLEEIFQINEDYLTGTHSAVEKSPKGISKIDEIINSKAEYSISQEDDDGGDGNNSENEPDEPQTLNQIPQFSLKEIVPNDQKSQSQDQKEEEKKAPEKKPEINRRQSKFITPIISSQNRGSMIEPNDDKMQQFSLAISYIDEFKQKTSVAQISNKTEKNRINKPSSINNEQGVSFHNKIALNLAKKDIQKIQRSNNPMPMMNQLHTLKHIQEIYKEKIKQLKANDKSNLLLNVVYDYFTNQYGFNKNKDQKLQQFVTSLLFNCQQPKIQTFCQLYGLIKNEKESNTKNILFMGGLEAFNFYVQCMKDLEQGNVVFMNLPSFPQGSNTSSIQFTVTVGNKDTGVKHYQISKCLEIFVQNFNDHLPVNVYSKFKNEIETLKTPDPNNKSRPLIDAEKSLEILFNAWLVMKQLNMNRLRGVYLAGDIDGDQCIGYEEFKLLFRHIQQGRLHNVDSAQLFFDNCDIVDELTKSKTMSFTQFADFSIEEQYFSQEIQEKYEQNIDYWERIRRMDELVRAWESQKDVIRLRFIQTGEYQNLYRNMVKQIDQFVQNELQEGHQDAAHKESAKTVWLVFRLLDDQSKQCMLQNEINKFLPPALNIANDFIVDHFIDMWEQQY